jgi:adenosylcobinamide-GDP ribazoletransferase
MQSLRFQLELFLTALQFLTRLPVPRSLPYSSQRLRASTAYYPLVGFLVGSVAAAVILSTPSSWSLETRLILATAATVMLTGGFHEDGFADACDGLGGGWTRQRVLEIMKDSRLGTFGVLGLLLALASKVALLSELNPQSVPWALVVGHGFSRFLAVCLAYGLPYVGREDFDKPTASGISMGTLAWAAILTITPMSWSPGPWMAWLLPGVVCLGFASYLRRRLGGYTGDCLGACQTLCEITFYLGVAW